MNAPLVPLDRGELAPLEEACRLLSEYRRGKDIASAKLLHDQTETFVAHAHRRRLGLESMRDAGEVKIRTERTLGEVLLDVPRSKGGRPEENSNPRSSRFQNCLLEHDIKPETARRWQRVARIEPEVFERYVVEVRRTEDEELTTAGLLCLARAAPGEPDFDLVDEHLFLARW